MVQHLFYVYVNSMLHVINICQNMFMYANFMGHMSHKFIFDDI